MKDLTHPSRPQAIETYYFPISVDQCLYVLVAYYRFVTFCLHIYMQIAIRENLSHIPPGCFGIAVDSTSGCGFAFHGSKLGVACIRTPHFLQMLDHKFQVWQEKRPNKTTNSLASDIQLATFNPELEDQKHYTSPEMIKDIWKKH